MKYVFFCIVIALSLTIFLPIGSSDFHMIFNIIAVPLGVFFLIIGRYKLLKFILIAIMIIVLQQSIQLTVWMLKMNFEDGMAVPISFLFLLFEIGAFIIILIISRIYLMIREHYSKRL